MTDTENTLIGENKQVGELFNIEVKPDFEMKTCHLSSTCSYFHRKGVGRVEQVKLPSMNEHMGQCHQGVHLEAKYVPQMIF